MVRKCLGLVVLLATLALVPGRADARAQQDLLYPPERVWNAAVRLLRLELGCTIVERDAEVGYVVFEYPDGARTYPGSIELVRTSIDDVPLATRLFVSIPAMPRYVEVMIADRIMQKMMEEYGEPVRRPRVLPRSTTSRDTARQRSGTARVSVSRSSSRSGSLTTRRITPR